MSNGWDDERRAKQSAAIHRWQPWRTSTGPKSEAGKKLVAQNGRKHGFRSREFQESTRLIRKLLTRALRVDLIGIDHG